MQRDKLFVRVLRKAKKELVKWRWKRWLKSVQNHHNLEKNFVSAFGKLSKLDAENALDSAKALDLFAVDEIHTNGSFDQINIFGSSLEYRDISGNWHRDFIHNISWPIDWHWNIAKVRNDGSDVKVPWELSRCHFLLPLAIRYKKTGQEKYASRIVGTIASWIRLNPVGKGVNWTCAMDVAIRAVTWLVVYQQITRSSSLHKEFKWEFYKSIYSHGRFIESNLEGPGWYAANHYLANLTGLFFIGALVPACSNTSTRWTAFAARELEREILRQVNNDGGCFENSTSYHRLSFELFFYPYWLGGKLGYVFSPLYKNRLMKMIEVVSSINKPNNRIPQIGDNDSGRLLDFGEHVLDHRYILDIGALQFDMEKLVRSTNELSKTAKALYGMSHLPIEKKYKRVASEPKLSCFEDTGWYVLEIQPWWGIFNTGPRSPSIQHPGHSHRDRLSFELTYESENVLVDPGTFVYTSDPIARQRFRSAAYHNVLCTDASGEPDEDAFYQEPLASAKVREATSNEQGIRLVAELDCDRIAWSRTINVNVHEYSVFDKVNRAIRSVDGSLNFHPDVMTIAVDAAKSTATLHLKTGKELTIQFFGVASIRLEESFYSEGYGMRVESKRLSYSVDADRCGFSIKV